jgi:two-component system sensor histidine kinase VicK
VETILDGDVGEFDEEVREYLQQIFTSSDRLSELVGSLLDVSRLELGTFAIEPEMVSLQDIVKSIVAEMKPTIDGRKIIYTQEFQEDMPNYSGDSQLLGIIFQNLISNAIKYTPDEGKVDMTVKIMRVGETFNTITLPEDSVGIAVSDTGYGIPSYEQGKIFQKLFRAENVKSQKEGTGLGLYIVKSIVDEVGGNIWFESEENKGTTFYVTLPLKGMEPRKGTKKLGS